MQINENRLSKEEQELLQELMSYRFSNRVYKYYIGYTEDNKDVSYDEARKKVLRNIILAKKDTTIREDRPERIVVYYGNLSIIYDTKQKEIAWMKEFKGKYDFDIDQDKKEWLNGYLGIKGVDELEGRSRFNLKRIIGMWGIDKEVSYQGIN